MDLCQILLQKYFKDCNMNIPSSYQCYVLREMLIRNCPKKA
jgi:hypothetical protein